MTPFKFNTFTGQSAVKGNVPDQDDPYTFPEEELNLLWASNPQATWIVYECWVEVSLDAGMALHKPLPQYNPQPDQLGTIDIQDGSMDMDKASGGGVNLVSNSTAKDVIQRMATSTYRFVLQGYGLRAGYQIPIPILKSVAGLTPVPEGTQRGFNVLVGNFAGIPLWWAQWYLPYIIKGPIPKSQAKAPIPFNPALHIRPDVQLPLAINFPTTQTDDYSIQQAVFRTTS